MSTNPPKIFGALLGLYGLALAGLGFYVELSLRSADYYYVVIGAGYAVSGVLFFLGRSAAVSIANLTLFVVWLWSLSEVGVSDAYQLFMRVGFPTVIALYILFSDIRSRLHDDFIKPDARRLTADEELKVERALAGASSAATIAVQVLVMIVLVYGAKDALGTLSRIAVEAPALWNPVRILWMALPYVAFACVLFNAQRLGIGYWSLLFVAIMTALFGMGVYTMIPEHAVVPQDTHALIWVPIAQIAWAVASLYVIATRQ